MRSNSSTLFIAVMASLAFAISAKAQAHLDNPFVGATFYRNVDYVAAVNAAATLQGGAVGQQMRRVADHPTFVWLDTIAAVNGTGSYPRGLAGHLDQALLQGVNAIGIVIYNLPNRDGSALASNGELLIAASWSTAGVTVQILIADETEQTVRASIPVGTSARRFIRLRITQP